MKYIIVGCGRAGSELADRLFRDGHQVVIIDPKLEAFNRLPADFRGQTIEANVLEEGVLANAGIQEADGLAAMTNFDTLNAVVGHIARHVYHLEHVIVRNYDPNLRDLHEAFGLQAVSSTAWGAQKIEELLFTQTLKTVFTAGNGEIEVYQVLIPDHWDGKTLADLLGGIQPCAVVALTRAGRAFLPAADAALQRGDVLNVSASLDSINQLQACLHGKEA